MADAIDDLFNCFEEKATETNEDISEARLDFLKII